MSKRHQVSTDRRSGIVTDPNRADDPEYIVRLLGWVMTVSVETVKHVRELAEIRLEACANGSARIVRSRTGCRWL